MENREVQDFLYFMTHSKSLSREQQKRRDELLAKSIVTQEAVSTENGVMKGKKQNVHSPKDTATFLSLFDRREGFKYLTHNYDNNNTTLNEMLKQVKKVYEEEIRGKNIPKSLVMLLYNFLNGGYWLDSMGNKKMDGYSDPSWLEWSQIHNDKHPITDIGGMETTIQSFRHTVRVVAPDLEQIINRISKELPSLHISMINLNKADFFTNVFVLNSRLLEIFKDIKDHAEDHNDVQVEYVPDISGQFFLHQIRISQFNSFSAKKIEDVLRKYNSTGGFFYENAEKLRGYCNWYVESLWDGMPFRWNILDDTDAKTIEIIDTKEVKGFTHVLTFYGKS